MKVPSGYHSVYIVHVGPQIRDMYTEPEEAVKHVKRLVDGGEPGEFESGLLEFAQKCFDRGRGNQIRLTMADARRKTEQLDVWLEAWKKGRK